MTRPFNLSGGELYFRSRSYGRCYDKRGARRGHVGLPTELSFGDVLDANLGENIRQLGLLQHARSLPVVADQLPLAQISRNPSTERREDDKRTPARAAE